jgi:outer membrane lipoprotein-sorting protein
MKKNFKLIALIMGVFLILSGCSGESSNDSSTDSEETVSQNEVVENPDVAEPVEEGETGKVVLPEMPENYSYEIEMNGEGMKTNAKYWFQGDNYRMEMNSVEMGQNIVIISSEKDEAIYMYYPDMKMATKMSNDSDEAMESMMAFEPIEYEEDILDNYLNFEETTYDGQDAYYFELNDADEESENGMTKVWISKDYGILLKMEHYMEGNLAYSASISNIEMGPFDDDLFTVPEDVEITSF